MARPTPKPPAQSAFRTPDVPSRALEVIDPRWLLKALAIAVAAASLLAYLSLCLLLYIAGWQLILHPSRAVDRTPAALGIAFDPIRFDAALTGSPRLTAWWIPSKSTPTSTILFLHDGTGSLSSSLQELALLHRANVNVFAIDPRGFGLSSAPHPTEATMHEDTEAALDYLVNTRHIPSSSIVPYGIGLSAVLAATLTHAHPELPALILDNPDPTALDRAASDKRLRFLPARRLLRDHFDPAPITSLTLPRLLITGGPADTAPDRDRATTVFTRSLPNPKLTVEIPARPQDLTCLECPDLAYIASVKRFLDQYLAAPVETLSPTRK